MACDIFISYRKDDTLKLSGDLYESLTEHFGAESVFYDESLLNGGDKWPNVLDQKVRAAKVVLMAYRTKKVWLGVNDDGDRRIDSGDDWVRRELEIALNEGKVIIPVFFGKDELPAKEKLPLTLQPLREFHGKKVRGTHWVSDLKSLFDDLKNHGVQRRDNQPAVKADPLKDLPLPGKDKLGLPRHPYKGLTWFEAADARIFFGRETEIAELYKTKLCNTDKRIVLFYGQSGAGKSSLLHAGLMPRLKHQGWTVIYRRRTSHGSVNEIAAAVLDELKRMQEEVQPLLVIDQLEEVFTHPLESPPTDDEKKAMPNLLDELLNAHPKLRIILGFRKEYLADIKRILNINIPEIEEYNLGVMDDRGLSRAVAAIPEDPILKKKFKKLSFAQGENLPDYIAEELFAPNTRDNAAPLLQFVLRKMWDEQLEQGRSEVTFSRELFERHRRSSLKDLLETQLDILSKKLPEAVFSGLAIDLLRFFVTDGQTAGQKSLDDIKERYNHHPPENIEKLCRELTNLYLLSVVDPNNSYRLAHDALAPAVISNYTKSIRPGQLARLILESKLDNRLDIGRNNNGIDFTPTDLKIISEGEKGMYNITQEWKDIIKDNKNRYGEIRNRALESAIGSLRKFEFKDALNSIRGILHLTTEDDGDKILEVLMDIAFFYTETKSEQDAKRVFENLSTWKNNNYVEILTEEGAFSFDAAQKILKDLNNEIFDSIYNKYFPKMIKVEGGDFRLLNSDTTDEVQTFYMASTPITFAQYYLFLKAVRSQERDRFEPNWGIEAESPVVMVKLNDIDNYASWLTRYERIMTNANINHPDTSQPGLFCYRLPTEVEWEYAAREGVNWRQSNDKYSGSDDIEQVAWFRGNSDGKTHGINEGGKIPNKLGFLHMTGNVWEVCKLAQNENEWVFRGGAYNSSKAECDLANVKNFIGLENNRYTVIGFRLVCTYCS